MVVDEDRDWLVLQESYLFIKLSNSVNEFGGDGKSFVAVDRDKAFSRLMVRKMGSIP